MKNNVLEKIKYSKIAYLEITSFKGCCVRAEHYYGVIKDHKHNEIRLNRVINDPEEINYLNKKDYGFSIESRYGLWKKGDETERFNSIEELRKEAEKVFKENFPDCKVLIEGSSSTIQPQLCLLGPPVFKRIVNKFYRKYEKLYEQEEKGEITEEKMDEKQKIIWKQWYEIWQKVK